MILQNGTADTLASLVRSNPEAKKGLSLIPPFLVERAEVVMLMSEMGEPIGFVLLSKADEKSELLTNALFGLWLSEELNDSFCSALVNLIRSLRLSAVLVRSDDLRTIKELLHYPMEYLHVAQVYRVLPRGEKVALEKSADLPSSAMRSSSTPGTIGAPLFFDANRLAQVHTLAHGSKIVAAVEVYEGSDSQSRYLYPSVTPSERRLGHGLSAVVGVAQLLDRKGVTAYLPIDPTDDAARRFAQRGAFVPAFDYLRITPRFHLPPYPVPDEEPIAPRRRRRRSKPVD